MKMLRKATPNLISRLPRTTASLLAAAVIALLAGAGTAIALADNGNTSAVAINTKDGSSTFRLTFGVRQVNGSTVDPQNGAVAISSCSSCQTVAISVEVVLASGTSTTVTPVNEAIAINENCSSCDTLAAAYQFVYALGTRLNLTAEGRQELAYIRLQLEQLRNSGLSTDEINAQVEVLMGQLSNVLNNQVIGVNDPAAGPGTGTAATTPSSSSPTASSPTGTTSPMSAPTDTTTAPADTTTTTTTTTPTDTTTAPADTTTTTATTTPTDTTSSGATTTPTTSTPTSPTTTTTTTPTPTTTTP